MRIGYIDSFKGVGILGVVMIHLPGNNLPPCLLQLMVYWAVFSFFFISGWMYHIGGKNRTPREHFKIRLEKFGRIYLIFTIIYIGFDITLVMAGWYEPIIILKDVYKSVVFTGIGTLWFLPVLFLGETLFVACLNYNRNKRMVVLSILTTVSFILFTWSEYCRDLYYSGMIGQALCMPIDTVGLIGESCLFISLGYLCAKHILPAILIIKNKYGDKVLIMTGLFLMALSVLCSFQVSEWRLFFARLVLVVPLSLAVIMITMSLKNDILSRFFSFWGRNSLILMCTHYSLTLVLIEIADVWINGEIVPSLLRTSLYMGICLFLTYCLIRIKFAERFLNIRMS